MDVSHSVLFVSCFFCDVTARCVRMSNRHLLITSVPGFHRHIPCTSLNSSSFPLFHSLCLSDSVFVCIHPCFSRQGSLNDRSDSLSAFVIMWLCRSSMRCKRSTAWTTSSVSVSFNVRRQNVESSSAQPLALFSTTILGKGGAPSLSAVTSSSEPPFATECHTNLPSSSIPKHHSVSVSSNFCLAQLHYW